MLRDWLDSAVKGVISIEALTNNWQAMQRHICDTPRVRKRRSLEDLETFNTKLQSLS